MKRRRFAQWKPFIAVLAIVTVLPSPLLFLPSRVLKAEGATAGKNPTEDDRARMRAEYEAYLAKEKQAGQERLGKILATHEAGWKPIALTAPYWKQGDGFASTLTINNTRPRIVVMTAVVRAADGGVLQERPISIRATGSLDVPLATLIGDQEGYGQIALRYVGDPLEINAVLVVADPARSLVVDHPFELAEDFSSSELDGVFYMPSASTRSEIALANTSDQVVSVLVSVRPENQNASGALSQQVAVMPHQTELVNVRPLLRESNGLVPLAARVTVKHTGNPSDLRVHGMLMDANGYSSNMRFLERSALMGNKLFSPILPLQNSVNPIVLLTNTNSGAATVHLEAYYSLNGELEETTLRTVSVPAGGALHANLAQEIQGLPMDASNIGLVIEHYKDGGLLADVLLMDGSGSGVFQVSPKGYAGHAHNNHSFPFRLDGSLNTTITIANPSATDEILYSLNLYYEGKVYGVEVKPLRPGEVRNVDIKSLRDRQTPGALQELLPENITGGQATLSFRRKRKLGDPAAAEATHVDHDVVALGIASATVFDVDGKIAFVTCWPQCQEENWTMEIGNQYYVGIVGDAFTSWITVYNVNNGYFNLEASDVDWTQTGSPVTSVDGNNWITLESAGYADLSAYVTIVDDQCDQMCSCVQIFGQVLFLQGWVESYAYSIEITSVNFDNPDPDDDTIDIDVDGPYWTSPTIRATAKREGDDDVIFYEGTPGYGNHSIPFKQDGQTMPEGQYFQIIVNVVGTYWTDDANVNRAECNDARTRIIREYPNRGTDWTPVCADLVTSKITTFFVTSEYNHNGYHSYFIARDTLATGADGTRTSYGSALITTGGYRCPDKQNDINASAVQGSRHHHGDAMDWSSSDNDGIWATIKAAAKTNGACVEPLTQSTNDHVHADWRPTCPNSQW